MGWGHGTGTCRQSGVLERTGVDEVPQKGRGRASEVRAEPSLWVASRGPEPVNRTEALPWGLLWCPKGKNGFRKMEWPTVSRAGEELWSQVTQAAKSQPRF